MIKSMHIKKCILSLGVLLMAATLSMTAEAQTRKTILLTAGKADTVTLDKSVADILVANPSIADVGTLRADRLYVVGKSIGDTNILAFDEEGNQMADISVRVRVDENNLRDVFNEFFPKENVSIKTVKDNIILSGRVSTPAVANQVRDLASRFVTGQGKTIVDLMSVEGEQQVMLKVKVLEARRATLREYGIETDYRVGKGNFVNSTGTLGLQALTPFATGQIMIDRNGDLGPFQVALSGLERDGLVNTLAEPNLTAISGETAGFLAGGEFPIPVGRDNQGNVTIEFKQFGVSLNFTPTVLASDRISLQLSTEVSAKSEDDAVTLVDTQIPGLTVRRAETTVQIGSGGTIMMAGLIKSDTLNNMNGMPGLQDVPILGNLFRSKSFARNESELLILVTPYIVSPYVEAQAVREVSAPPVMGNALLPPPLPVKDTGIPHAVASVPVPAVSTAPITTAKAAPAAASVKAPASATRYQPQGLSQAFARNVKDAYGGSEPAVLQKKAAGSYGYLVD